MRTLVFFVCCVALVASVGTAIAQNFRQSSSQTSIVQSNNSNDMNNFQTFSSQQSSNSSGYQQSTLNLSAVNLNQPHILSINTSGTQLTGEITLNGKVIKQLSSNRVELDLSPLLTVGEQKFEISARYTPASSSVSVELNAPGSNVIQQTSGNGILNYVMTITVR